MVEDDVRSEIREKTQGMKNYFNKEIEISKKNQGNKPLQTNQDTPITESIDTTVEEMSEKEFRMYIVKLVCGVKDDVRSEIRDKIQEVKITSIKR